MRSRPRPTGARGDLAMALLRQIQDRFQLDASLLGVALSACRRGSDWQEALSLSQRCPELQAAVFALQANLLTIIILTYMLTYITTV